MSKPKVAIAITADDKTARGARSAEKRIGAIPKHSSAVIRRQQSEIARHSRGILRTITDVEQSSARVFGGRSVTSGFASRLGAVRAAAAAAGTGLGEAAASGGLLTGALGAVGVAAGTTVGFLAAAAYGMFKLTSGWSKGAATIGRTAELIGVSTDMLQKFSAAAERAGVDKGTAGAALGGLSDSLNGAAYGTNGDARAILAKLKVRMRRKSDGTADVDAMLPDIATALSQHNPYAQRIAAGALGIPEAALSAFRQGGKALADDMADAAKTAYVATPGNIKDATRIDRKGTIVSQMTERGMGLAGAGAASVTERGYDVALSAGQQMVGGATSFTGVVENTFAPGAAAVERGGKAIERAAARLSGGNRPGLTSSVVRAAQATHRRYGVPASITLAQYGLESSFGRRMPRGSNNPFGIKARPGEPFVSARTREEDRFGRSYWINAKFRKFDSIDDAFDAHAKLLQGRRYAKARGSRTTGEYADALTGVYATDQQYGRKLKDVIHQNGLERHDQAAQAPVPVKVEVEFRGNVPPGARAKATARGRNGPAVSYAWGPPET